jgi:hypothetical protein
MNRFDETLITVLTESGVTAYCFKCKTNKDMLEGGEEVEFKNGRIALMCACPDCNGKMYRMKKK